MSLALQITLPTLVHTGLGGSAARTFWGADMKNLGSSREPRAQAGLAPKPFSLGIALVLLGSSQRQEALGSGGQQLVTFTAQYYRQLVAFIF